MLCVLFVCYVSAVLWNVVGAAAFFFKIVFPSRGGCFFLFVFCIVFLRCDRQRVWGKVYFPAEPALSSLLEQCTLGENSHGCYKCAFQMRVFLGKRLLFL